MQNGLWTAALSRQHSLPVISRDFHFDFVGGWCGEPGSVG
jgi:hypothetical protein